MTTKNIYYTIKKYRESKGISQSLMASKLGMSLNGYAKIERGITTINLDKLESIAQIFEVTILDLFQEPVDFVDPIQKLKNQCEIEKLQIELEHAQERIEDLNTLLDERTMWSDKVIAQLESEIQSLKNTLAFFTKQ